MITALTLPARAVYGLALALAVLAALTLTGAQVTEARSTSAGAVYTISNATTGNQVLAFNRAPDGTLAPAGAFSAGGAGNGASLGSQGALALSFDGRYIVAVNAGSNTVALLAVRPNGLELVDVEGAGGVLPTSVTLDGDLAYVVNDGSDNIAGFRFDKSGLTPVGGSVQPLTFGGAPGQISFDASGEHLIVTLKDTNQIVVFAVNADGSAGAGTATASAAPTPFGFAIDRHNRALVSEAPNSDLSSYQIGSDGSVALIDGPVPNGQAAACWVALSKDGRYAFSSNAGNATISTYAIANDGSLSLVHAVAGATVGGPQDLAVSNDGQFLYAVSRAAHTITEFAINGDGALTQIGSISDLAMGSSNGLVAN